MTDELQEVTEQEAPEAEAEESTQATDEMDGETTTAEAEPTPEAEESQESDESEQDEDSANEETGWLPARPTGAGRRRAGSPLP